MMIGIGNKKGGTGKSTLAINMLVYLNDLGYKTALVDTDAENKDDLFPAASEIADSFGQDVFEVRTASTLIEISDAKKELEQSGFHIIFDSPGEKGEKASALCLLSDLVLVPMVVSPKDVRQTAQTLSWLQYQQRRNNGKPDVVIVLSMTDKRATIGPRMMRQELSEHYDFPIARTEIRRLEPVKLNATVMRMRNAFKEGTGPGLDTRNLIEEVIIPRLKPLARAGNE